MPRCVIDGGVLQQRVLGFSTHTWNADSLLGEGIFTAAYRLRDGGQLAAYEHALLAEPWTGSMSI